MRQNRKYKKHICLLAAGFGMLSSLPFLMPHSGLLSLVAFIPLFYMSAIIRENGIRRGFLYYYAAFLFFNVASTFWIWFVSGAGAIAAILLNTLQMATVFAIYRWSDRVTHRCLAPFPAKAISLLFFIISWIAWEHVYFRIEISWPWLCLGNSFATTTRLVQWYEIFGAVGGSMWILLCNAAIFLALDSRSRRERRNIAVAASLLVLVPIICSEIRYFNYRESEDPMEVVIIQPNVDPFHKYGVDPQSTLDAKLVRMMSEYTTPETRYVITPETFTYNLDIDHPSENSSYRQYQAFLSGHPGTEMILGALTFREYQSPEKPSRSARPLFSGSWVDIFNTAMILDREQVHGYYFKSKLVPGVEIIPYENVLTFLTPLITKFGGSSNSYGTQEEMEAIPDGKGKKVGVMICYESVYGDWSRVATKKGAEMLAVITNDGWWGDTPGYRQHFNFARLRAIENRRDVVQAANTGTSGVINQRGDVVCKTDWWVECAVRETINASTHLTPFVRHGDFMGRAACIAFFVLLAFMVFLVVASGRLCGRGKSAADRT